MSESPYERIARLERKNTLLSLSVLVLVLMLTGLAFVGWEWAERERLTAESQRLEAIAALKKARRVASSLGPAPPPARPSTTATDPERSDPETPSEAR